MAAANPIQSYRELEVWKKTMELVTEVNTATLGFPKNEQFGLTAQLRRASVSVPSNIAEGYGRSHRGDYLHHLSIARGSLCEIETQLIIAGRLMYIGKDEARKIWNLAQDVGKMLLAMQRKLSK